MTDRPVKQINAFTNQPGPANGDFLLIQQASDSVVKNTTGQQLIATIGIVVDLTPQLGGNLDSNTFTFQANPVGDADIDIITVGVTGTPTLSWDESENAFQIEPNLILGASGNNVEVSAPNSLRFSIDSDNTQTDRDFRIYKDRSVATGNGTLIFHLEESGFVAINDSTNANMTQGLTIKQGANDDEILALKSSDVAHGMTDIAETDTWLRILKSEALAGGAKISGMKDADGFSTNAILIEGLLGEAATTGKTTSTAGVVSVSAAVKSVANVTDVGADGNLFAIRNNSTTRLVVDAEGTIHQIPGSDIDIDLLTVQVTGTPTISWDESDDQFKVDKAGFHAFRQIDSDNIIRVDGADLSSENLQLGVQPGYAVITAGFAGSGDNALVFKTSNTTESEKMRLNKDGMLLIGDTANANMTVGLTINQGANDNEILALKSSDVAHGMTGLAEADTFGKMQKADALSGGLYLWGLKDADGTSDQAIKITGTLGEVAGSGKSTANYGVVRISANVTDGGTSWAAVAADGNLASFDNFGTTRWILDAEGTMHQLPGSDIDIDLITVQVTGTPTFSWDESANRFSSTHVLQVIETASAGLFLGENSSAGFLLAYEGGTNTLVLDSTGFNNMMVFDRDSGLILMGDDTNANMTRGLTINQGANDNEILALKSSDVGHAMTGVAEADTYATLLKSEATSGGLRLWAYKDADGGNNSALYFGGMLGEAVTATKTTGSYGVIRFRASVTDGGTSVAALAANGNIASFDTNNTTVWILDEDGDIFYGGTDDGTITDDYDDVQLLAGFRAVLSPTESPARKVFKGFVKDTEDILVEQGVLSASLADGGMVSTKGLNGLMIDAMRQMYDKINKLETQLAEVQNG